MIGKEGGQLFVGVCCSSVAEHWQLKPEALDLSLGITTIVSFAMTVTALIMCMMDTITIGAQTKKELDSCDFTHDPVLSASHMSVVSSKIN